MVTQFMDLPLELRREIYAHLFGKAKAIVSVSESDHTAAMVPSTATFQTPLRRSSQLLRVNRTIYHEAQPVLYANTTFHIVAQEFAGRLPIMITNGHLVVPHLQHLIWQLDCDMLKHFYADELRFDSTEIAQWSSLEIRCRAETWRDSFIGQWCDREAFVKSREQLIVYARAFRNAMNNSHKGKVRIVEDRSQLGRGRVILKLTRREIAMRPEECLVE